MNQLDIRPPRHERDATPRADDEIVTDAAMRRVFVAMGVLAVVAVIGLLFVAAARWATADDGVEPFGNADIGFMQDMIDHHQQALEISNAYLDANPDGAAAPYAREVIWFQERDIARMDSWLAEAGMTRGAPDRQAMGWMDMPTAVEQMPGMQTQATIDQLGQATGAEADRLFFEIMTEHHLGGAHMADAAAAGARRSEIREFAEKMAYNQRIEVVEYEQAIERLGL